MTNYYFVYTIYISKFNLVFIFVVIIFVMFKKVNTNATCVYSNVTNIRGNFVNKNRNDNLTDIRGNFVNKNRNVGGSIGYISKIKGWLCKFFNRLRK